MSTSSALYTSESLKANDAPTYASLKGRLNPGLLQSLQDMKYEFMTPVQSRVMAELPTMQSDCLVQAKTGTGKTIAFLLPAIENMLQRSLPKGQVAILIMSPTRELALQIAAEAEKLVKKLQRPLQVHTAFGGTAKASAVTKFRNGDPKILVATPGRLNDYLTEEDLRQKFTNMSTLVLDEADRMLDQGFLPDILKILHALPPKHGPSGGWQGMCFSATIPPRMQQVFSHVLAKDHVSISTLDASEPPTLARVPQYSVIIPSVVDTFNALFTLLKLEIKATEGDPKIIVFGTTANLVAAFAKAFTGLLNLEVFELHSRLSQSARTRATDQFKVTKRGIMFASDVIGRGMDFPNVSLVVQVGLPLNTDAYTHRVGRTARAGKDGRAIILLTQLETFFLRDNRHFPIQPYPNTPALTTNPSDPSLYLALQHMDADTKRKAYSAYMGFMKGFCSKMRITPAELVQLCNTFAIEGMLSGEVPTMEKKTIGKMGLKGVPGIRYADPATSAAGRSGAQVGNAGQRGRNGGVERGAATSAGGGGAPPMKRPKHQGPPGGAAGMSFNSGPGSRAALDFKGRGVDGLPRANGGMGGVRRGNGRGGKWEGRGQGQRAGKEA